MPAYPIIFALTFDVRCSEFSARVVARGRVLMEMDDGEWWCHGVDPGGISACAPAPPHAFLAFKEAFNTVLRQLAGEAGSFDRFQRAARGLMNDQDRNEAERWEQAREAYRAGASDAGPFSELKKVTGHVETSVEIKQLDKLLAGEETIAMATAA